MRWPDRPTCHRDVTRDVIFNFGAPTWRPIDASPLSACDCGYQAIGPYGYPFRTCSYCGSISPEDLTKYLLAPGVQLRGTDWKYGWPHKFYVEGITNPLAGGWVDSTSTGRSIDHEPTVEEIDEDKRRLGNLYDVVANVRPPGWCPGYPANSFWHVCIHGRSPAPATTFAKFYSEHILDEGYDDAARALLLRSIQERSDVAFSVTAEGKLHYAAPAYGYQR